MSKNIKLQKEKLLQANSQKPQANNGVQISPGS